MGLCVFCSTDEYRMLNQHFLQLSLDPIKIFIAW